MIDVFVAEAGRVKSLESSGTDNEISGQKKSQSKLIKRYAEAVTCATADITHLYLILLVFCSPVSETQASSMTFALCFHLGF